MDGTVLGPMISKHFSGEYNERHPAIGYLTKDGWGGGVFINSYNKPSFFAGKEFRHPLTDKLDAVLSLGGVTGYAKPVLPLVTPGLVYELGGGHQVGLLGQPPVRGLSPGLLALQYRYRLK